MESWLQVTPVKNGVVVYRSVMLRETDDALANVIDGAVRITQQRVEDPNMMHGAAYLELYHLTMERTCLDSATPQRVTVETV
jgi:hypothetical protein